MYRQGAPKIRIKDKEPIDGKRYRFILQCDCGVPECEHAQKTSPCRSRDGKHGCGQPIIWVVTQNGYNFPVDWKTREPHWAVCPDAEYFRSRKKNLDKAPQRANYRDQVSHRY